MLVAEDATTWPLATDLARHYVYLFPKKDNTTEFVIGQLAVIESAIQNEQVRTVAGGRTVWLGGAASEVWGNNGTLEYAWASFPLEGQRLVGPGVTGKYTNFDGGVVPRSGGALVMQPDGTWCGSCDKVW